MSNQSYTVDEFCKAECMSRSMVYKLWSQGKGPRWFQVGNRRHISHEARTEWRRRLEAEAESTNGYRHDSKAEARPE